MNWMLVSESLDNRLTCIGVYATLKAAKFIKRNKEGKKDGCRYKIIKSDSSLRPETSWKVDKYLESLRSLNPEQT